VTRVLDLDPEQRDVLMWILDQGSGEVVVAPVPGAGNEVDLVIPRGPRRRAAERDVARLVDLLLLQHVQRKVYRVTELGREVVRPRA
jgi:predicted secreted Zn-dependent protease